MKIVGQAHELMLISEEGVVIRVKAEDISSLGRSTQGVKVMNVSDTDRVSAIARVNSNKKKKSTAERTPEGQMNIFEQSSTAGQGETSPEGAAPNTEVSDKPDIDDLMADEFDDE